MNGPKSNVLRFPACKIIKKSGSCLRTFVRLLHPSPITTFYIYTFVMRGSYVDTSKCHSLTTESLDWSKNEANADIAQCSRHPSQLRGRPCIIWRIFRWSSAPTGDVNHTRWAKKYNFSRFFFPFGAKPIILLAHYKRDRQAGSEIQ